MSSFGNAFRKFRNSKHKKQDEIAGILDVQQSYIAKIETGHIGVTLFMAERIASKLDARLSYDPKSGWQMECR